MHSSRNAHVGNPNKAPSVRCIVVNDVLVKVKDIHLLFSIGGVIRPPDERLSTQPFSNIQITPYSGVSANLRRRVSSRSLHRTDTGPASISSTRSNIKNAALLGFRCRSW